MSGRHGQLPPADVGRVALDGFRLLTSRRRARGRCTRSSAPASRPPTATALEERLFKVGVHCDCHLTANGYRILRQLMVRDLMTDELSEPDEMPDCAGVRRTSTKPCANWERRPLAEWRPGRHE